VIITGSFALALHGLRAMKDVGDIDLVGTRSEAEGLTAWLGDRVLEEHHRNGHHLSLTFMSGQHRTRIEFDYGQSPADQMLDGLCSRHVKMLNNLVKVPPLEVLYLIKRSHATVPAHFDKTVRDLLLLKPLIKPLTEPQRAFGRQCERESVERYADRRTRFAPVIQESDLIYDADNDGLYDHDDLHQAVALPGTTAVCACCTATAADDHEFPLPLRQLSQAQCLQIAREEFMVTGIERFYVRDSSLSAKEIYRLGLRKTIRDRFTGRLQNFCIDHIDQLIQPPTEDFIARFESARAQGHVRKAEVPAPSIGKDHEQIWSLIQQGRLDEARRLAEDKVRRSDMAGDPHACFMLGAILQMTGFLAQAEFCLRASLARIPDHAPGWLHLGLVMLQTGRTIDALNYLEAARRHGANDAPLFIALGMAYEENKNFTAARDAYRQAYAIDPEHPQAREKVKSVRLFSSDN
jgi:tetratricopeptide (TPR) repeat protein